ncbi:MAG: TIGR04076 family protein [Deltaproteobacteria bacterium]|nr:TIGR04076 family protein [Deltaproteobacteria bacterium]MBW2085710.1 TIGR04076 family protein [Deltaproteobacteria bacterium]
MKLVITVVEIKGSCPVYKIGDRITLQNGYILDPAATDTVCMHSLASILPYYVALSRGIKAADLNLSRGNSDDAYVQCLDPCEITGGGTVRFKISRLENS